MGSSSSAIMKLIDAILIFFYVVISIGAPLFDAQISLPQYLFPSFIVELNQRYADFFGDYFVYEKPHFIVGIVWVELIFQWPLAMACIYAILARKSWSGLACLVFGASLFSTMVAVLFELVFSNRASVALLTLHFPFLGFALLSMLRGVMTLSDKQSVARKSAPMKKNA